MKTTHTIAAVLAVALLAGCSTPGGKIDLTALGVKSAGQITKSESLIAVDGSQTASHSGLGPTLLKQDSEGTFMNSSLPVNLGTYDPATGKFYLASHADSSIEMVNPIMKQTEQGPELTADSLKIVIGSSAPITAGTLSYEQAYAQIAGLTEQQAQVEIQRMLTLGQITTDIASSLLATLATGGV
jgi:hypothetical protein